MTTTTQIHVVINELEGFSAGGCEIISYQVDYDLGSNGTDWQELKGFSTNNDDLFIIWTGLTINTEYRVRYRAKNIFGWSPYSQVTSIYTIMVPEASSIPVQTQLVGTNVMFNWTAPNNRGAPILYYNIMVQTWTGEYYLHTQYCNKVTQNSCSIPMQLLNSPQGPYNLTLNTLIQAIVSATNV